MIFIFWLVSFNALGYNNDTYLKGIIIIIDILLIYLILNIIILAIEPYMQS